MLLIEITGAPLVTGADMGGLSDTAVPRSPAFKRAGGPNEKLCDKVTLTNEDAPGWRPPPERLSEGTFACSWVFWPSGKTWENTRLVSSPSCLTGPMAWLEFGTVYTTALGARELKNTFPCCAVVESLVNVLPSNVLWFTEILPAVGKRWSRKNNWKG